MYVVLTLFSLVPLLIAGQVLRIYLTDGAQLREKGEQQQITTETIPATRGAIVDRMGRMLAVNIARYDVALDPTAKGLSTARLKTFFEVLSRLTGQSEASFRQKVNQPTSRQFVRLWRGITEDQKGELDELELPGLILRPVFARHYNYGSTASHLLGHVDADGSGIAGLELKYDVYLAGEDGRQTLKRDRLGTTTANVRGTVVEPKHGESLVLNIDLIRQTMLEEELARGIDESGAAWGTAIAMDPQTGAVLALANMPTYNPNRPGSSPTASRRNRAVTDRFEPGSTFKLVLAVAAIEKRIVSMNDSVETGNGWTVFHGRTMTDTKAHGTITFEDVIAQSSNVGTAKTAERMKQGDLYQYARNLGFGQPTWVDLPGEVPGLLKKPTEWSGTTLTSMSIGYEVDVTPLQLLTAYCALANGGLLVQPYVVAERRDVTGRITWRARQDSVRRAFSRKTARTLLPAFERAVENGTATRARIDLVKIAGKTGTAHIASGGSYDEEAYRASFVGFFPADDPVVAIIIVLDRPKTSGYGGIVAAPIFRRIANRWIGTFPTIAEQIVPIEQIEDVDNHVPPDVTGYPASVAERNLMAAGYRINVHDDDLMLTVSAQHPEAEQAVRHGARMELTLATDAGNDHKTMPNLKGWSVRDAVFLLSAWGVTVQVQGAGTVESHRPRAGETLPSVVVLQCR